MQYWLWSVPPDALASFVRAETFALRTQGRRALQGMRPGDRIFAYIPGSQTLAALVEASGEAFEDDTALVLGRHLPHRVRVRVLTVLPQEAWVPYDGFAPHLNVLSQYADEPTPSRQFRRVVQRVLHALPAIDGKVLEFLVAARAGQDPDALMEMVEAVRETRQRPETEPDAAPEAVAEPLVGYDAWDRAEAMGRLLEQIEARGFVYAPWEVAAFVTALRTRPFVLLAGVTGVGKSRLPQLVAEASGARADVLPVRPDWTDPSETLGYRGLDGWFRAGGVLRAARAAAESPDHYSMLVLDEMNLARPEHYLAEVLSRMEMRTSAASGGAETPPLVSEALEPDDAVWQAVRLGPTLGLVGTVNVDESAHAFSRKVLDRAFTLELRASDLAAWTAPPEAPAEDLG
ncbi:MAG: AAA family ATPase, partial [Bacteroidota bacterium]